jgi:hypothetical protein
MWPFKRKKESPEEKEALEKLDGVTFDLADAHLASSPRSIYFHPTPDDEGPQPTDEHGLRDALREGEQEYEGKKEQDA